MVPLDELPRPLTNGSAPMACQSEVRVTATQNWCPRWLRSIGSRASSMVTGSRWSWLLAALLVLLTSVQLRPLYTTRSRDAWSPASGQVSAYYYYY